MEKKIIIEFTEKEAIQAMSGLRDTAKGLDSYIKAYNGFHSGFGAVEVAINRRRDTENAYEKIEDALK